MYLMPSYIIVTLAPYSLSWVQSSVNFAGSLLCSWAAEEQRMDTPIWTPPQMINALMPTASGQVQMMAWQLKIKWHPEIFQLLRHLNGSPSCAVFEQWVGRKFIGRLADTHLKSTNFIKLVYSFWTRGWIIYATSMCKLKLKWSTHFI